MAKEIKQLNAKLPADLTDAFQQAVKRHGSKQLREVEYALRHWLTLSPKARAKAILEIEEQEESSK